MEESAVGHQRNLTGTDRALVPALPGRKERRCCIIANRMHCWRGCRIVDEELLRREFIESQRAPSAHPSGAGTTIHDGRILER